MTPELTYLAYATVLLLVHMMVQAAASDLVKGIPWALGSRDENIDPGVLGGRLERALTNYAYNFPAFVALALTLKVTDLSTETTALGAAIWFWARVAFLPLYAIGVPLLRSVAWVVSIAGLAMMILPLLQA
ncbi:MAG: MAPEG family protein [Pseudomonadota bacterium]